MAEGHRVYPRVCGGTIAPDSGQDAVAGLSPRVRGNLGWSRVALFPHGSIPACAGEPAVITGCSRRDTVYPRVCGGTASAPDRDNRIWGLSPRVRGNRRPDAGQKPAAGSIPACAGEPLFDTADSGGRRVYPRVCGGTLAVLGEPSAGIGLSPRVRGNPCRGTGSRQSGRSIPACAGEPAGRRFARRRRWVYPRVCGGTTPATATPRLPRGLSPRVRGNRKDAKDAIDAVRSIPACAGEPRAAAWDRVRLGKVYPRVCGGTSQAKMATGSNAGLSPRVRGNHRRYALGRYGCGSIPACAGEPRPFARPADSGTVYPRVCGGTWTP